MDIRFIRTLEEMRGVLMDPAAAGPDPVYTVYTNLDNEWINKTELSSGTYNGEFPKTFGHLHADGKDETYFVETGTGIIVMQTENGVLLKKITAGEKYVIPHQYEHCLVNIGNEKFVTFDDHNNPQADYKIVSEKHGLAVYIVNDAGIPKIVPNLNYSNIPEPKWINANESAS